MVRGRAAGEGLDDDHAAAATWTCRLVVIRSIGIGGFALELWRSEQFAGARDVVGAGGLCQQAVVADAMSAKFMSATVCPSLPLSIEITVLRASSVNHRLCLAVDVC